MTALLAVKMFCVMQRSQKVYYFCNVFIFLTFLKFYLYISASIISPTQTPSWLATLWITVTTNTIDLARYHKCPRQDKMQQRTRRQASEKWPWSSRWRDAANGGVESLAIVVELIKTHYDGRRATYDNDGDARPTRSDVEPVGDANSELFYRRPVTHGARRVDHQRQVDQRLARAHRTCGHTSPASPSSSVPSHSWLF